MLPGFKHIVLKPNPIADLKWVNSNHLSMYGRIVCNWKVEGSIFLIEVNIPVNCSATLFLPVGYMADLRESGGVLEKAEGISISGYGKDMVILELVSGEYKISAVKGFIMTNASI